MSQQNSLCFPCLEKVRTKFPVFPVPWPPWTSVRFELPTYWSSARHDNHYTKDQTVSWRQRKAFNSVQSHLTGSSWIQLIDLTKQIQNKEGKCDNLQIDYMRVLQGCQSITLLNIFLVSLRLSRSKKSHALLILAKSKKLSGISTSNYKDPLKYFMLEYFSRCPIGLTTQSSPDLIPLEVTSLSLEIFVSFEVSRF